MTILQRLIEDQDFTSGFGHRYDTAWRLSWLHNLIFYQAWPAYECIDCTATGMGCYCSYSGASAPGEGPTLYHLAMRWLWKRVNKDRG